MRKPRMIVALFLLITIYHCGIPAEKIPLKFESNSLKKNYKELVALGHKFYEEGAFVEALDQFEQASQLKQTIPPDLRYRMALLYHTLNEQTRVIELLQSKSTQKKIPEAHFLIALSYKELGQYPHANRHLKRYLELPSPEYREEALFELADVLFLQEKFPESCQILEALAKRDRNARVLLALSAALIWCGDYQRAEQILRQNDFNGEHLSFAAYLMGKVEENRGNYEQALEYFAEAKEYQSPKVNRSRVQLYEDEVELRLFLAEDWTLPIKERLGHLAKIPPLIQELGRCPGDHLLSIAHYWIVRSKLLGDPPAEILISYLPSGGETNDSQALFLRAELAQGHSEKEEIYKVLTAGSIQNPYVRRGWLMRGMNDLSLGRKTGDQTLLNRACFAFEQVWKTTLLENPPLASRAIQAQLEAYLTEKSRKSLKQAVQLVEATGPTDDPRLLYLQGLTYYHAGQFYEKERHWKKAEELWNKARDKQSDRLQVEFALGCLHFEQKEWEEAKDHFLQFQRGGLKHPATPEVLRLLAVCEERLGSDPTETRKMLYESFPDTPQGAEAYLDFFTRQDYIKGREEALDHLKGFFTRFPSSAWGIEAYYLLGMNAKRDHYTSSGKLIRPKKFEEAAGYLQKAADLYHGIEVHENKDYFRALNTQAKIERALVNLEIAEQAGGTKKQIFLEYTTDLLISLIEELTDPMQIEECRFALATTYEKMGQSKTAAQIYDQMLSQYREAKITRGVYLARCHYQLGMIYKASSETEKALEHFVQAEDAAKGRILSTEQYLDILIEQSLCHMDRDEDDRAMVILSKVINHDAASSLRLKAMFLRSHIYHKQSRDELAVRQLEALAKQQGEWAEKAKQELAAYEY